MVLTSGEGAAGAGAKGAKTSLSPSTTATASASSASPAVEGTSSTDVRRSAVEDVLAALSLETSASSETSRHMRQVGGDALGTLAHGFLRAYCCLCRRCFWCCQKVTNMYNHHTAVFPVRYIPPPQACPGNSDHLRKREKINFASLAAAGSVGTAHERDAKPESPHPSDFAATLQRYCCCCWVASICRGCRQPS